MGVSIWVQVPQVEKRVPRSYVLGSHERKGSKEKEECMCPAIRAEAGVIGCCKQHWEERAREKLDVFAKRLADACGRAIQYGGKGRISGMEKGQRVCQGNPAG